MHEQFQFGIKKTTDNIVFAKGGTKVLNWKARHLCRICFPIQLF